jgi:hypothetical protein
MDPVQFFRSSFPFLYNIFMLFFSNSSFLFLILRPLSFSLFPVSLSFVYFLSPFSCFSFLSLFPLSFSLFPVPLFMFLLPVCLSFPSFSIPLFLFVFPTLYLLLFLFPLFFFLFVDHLSCYSLIATLPLSFFFSCPAYFQFSYQIIFPAYT